MRVTLKEENCQYSVIGSEGEVLISGLGSIVEAWLLRSTVNQIDIDGGDRPLTIAEVRRLFRGFLPKLGGVDPAVLRKILDAPLSMPVSDRVKGRSIE
jgi:hypothetical protein